MVSRTEFDGIEAYRCDECGMHYRDEETAGRCETFCREQGGCSSRITRNALERSDEI